MREFAASFDEIICAVVKSAFPGKSDDSNAPDWVTGGLQDLR